MGRDLPQFSALFMPGPPLMGVRLLRFGGLFVAGPPRWGGPATVFSPFRACSTAPGGAPATFWTFFVAGPPRWVGTCHGFQPFSCLVHHPRGCACYASGVFRSRSTAVGRDLPRFSALFVPGPPPLGVRLLHFGGLFVAGPPRWVGTCHGSGPFSCLVHRLWRREEGRGGVVIGNFCLPLRPLQSPSSRSFFFEKGPMRDCCLFIMMSVAMVACQILVLPSGGAPCSLW